MNGGMRRHRVLVPKHDEVLWVDLNVMKDDEDGREIYVVDNRVVEGKRVGVSDWRFDELGSALVVQAGQHPTLEDVLVPV